MNNKIFLDIETTGFSALEDELITISTIRDEIRNNDKTKKIKTINDNFKKELSILGDYARNTYSTIITFNGENYHGGFDFPFLRTYCIKNEIDWPFKDVNHLDLFPLIKKRINTEIYELNLPSKSSLRKNDLVKLAEANNIEYTTINGTYTELMELYETDNVDWLDYASYDSKSKNDLQTIYQLFFDPDKNEEYIDGGEVPELYKEGKIEEINKHCENDIVRLKKVFEVVVNTIPDYYINKNTVTL